MILHERCDHNMKEATTNAPEGRWLSDARVGHIQNIQRGGGSLQEG